MFKVHLRNPGEAAQSWTLAFSFAGPDAKEARSSEFTRSEVDEDLTFVMTNRISELIFSGRQRIPTTGFLELSIFRAMMLHGIKLEPVLNSIG